MEANHGWGHIATLRIVDWGDKWINVSVTDAEGRTKIGNMSRNQYHRLLSDLRSLRVFELNSFSRDNVCDADLYRITVCDGRKRNRIQIYCPWDSISDSDTPATIAVGASYGSKPHADLVERLLEETRNYDLRWDICTYSFDPERRLIDTMNAEVADMFFTDQGELMYATIEFPEWAGGEAEEPDGCVVWHSADKLRTPLRIPHDVIDGGDDRGPGPLFPRPQNIIDTEQSYPPLGEPLTARDRKTEPLVQGRMLCNGKVAMCVATDDGTALIAYLTDHPSAYRSVLHLNDLTIHQKQIDIAPDGSRAAWINKGRLFVDDHLDLDCEWLVSTLESSVKDQ
ncbi:MAG TPA: hypothetical protein PKN33_03390 [Phycisphaerae bacterium]|nr:hypothetical protein [Phycisphaerae bacterium]